MIGLISHFIKTNKYYYIADKLNILKFKHNGKFVSKVGVWGLEPPGKGAVISLNLSPDRKSLYAGTVEEIFRFDMNDSLIGRKRIDDPKFFLSTFSINRKGYFLFRSPESNNGLSILACDSALNTIKKLKTSTIVYPDGYELFRQFATDGTETYFKELSSDTLFAITPDLEKVPRYHLIFDQNNYIRTGLYPMHDLICFDLLNKNKVNDRSFIIFFKKSGKLVCLGAKNGPRDIYIQHVPWIPVTAYGNTLLLQAYWSDISDNKEQITDRKLKKTSSQITEQSNAVLVEVKMKKR